MEGIESKSDLLKCDGFFSFYNILKIITNVDDFRKWLKEKQGLLNDEHIFNGYIFFLDTCFRCFLEKILSENSFDLDEDFTLYRAKFVGIEMHNVPNTCEKIIFTKNIWKLTQNVIESSGWEEVKKSIYKMNHLFDLISNIFEKEVVSVIDLDKDKALSVMSIFNTYICLNDLQRSIPIGYLTSSLFETRLDDNHFENNYSGYAYSLQYLWYKLLKDEDFEKSSLNDICNAHKIHLNKANDQNYLFQNAEIYPFEDKWIALDAFFSIIQKEIVKPLETKINQKLGIKSLLKINKINKNEIMDFLLKYKLEDPSYLKKEDFDSVFQKLDYYFYWYYIDTLDDEHSSVFNGVPAFTSILIGHAKKRDYYDSDKVCVLRIKHPIKGTTGYDYSYGILIQAFSSNGIADYSGWLIFFSCATDYSGFGGSLHAEAETFIKKFLDDKSLNVREIIIDKSLFREYLEYKKRPQDLDKNTYTKSDFIHNKFIVSEIKSQESRFLGDAKGKLFEYIYYNWLAENRGIEPVSLLSDIVINKEQVDVYLETENKIHIFECKVAIHGTNMDKIIKQIKRKKEAFEKSNKNINVWIVVYWEISDDNKRIFRKEGIKVCSNFKKKIDQWRKLDYPLNRDSRKIIKNIFDFEIRL